MQMNQMESNDKDGVYRTVKASRTDDFRSRGMADLEGVKRFRGRNVAVLGLLTLTVAGVCILIICIISNFLILN